MGRVSPDSNTTQTAWSIAVTINRVSPCWYYPTPELERSAIAL
ncbi:hypothetical protein [Stenomitos frigidus]|nr:hypothetical protein [Stenomitos frigidus]